MYWNTASDAMLFNYRRTGRARVTGADFGTRRDRGRTR
jgi:hypothetical protein